MLRNCLGMGGTQTLEPRKQRAMTMSWQQYYFTRAPAPPMGITVKYDMFLTANIQYLVSFVTKQFSLALPYPIGAQPALSRALPINQEGFSAL